MKVFLRWLTVGVLVLAGLVVAACAVSPLRWWTKPGVELTVQVVDKTVPHPDYREHRALYWVLRHDKLAAMDGSRRWELDRHYVGFRPDPLDEGGHGTGEDLTAAHLEGADLLYLADAYGVYRGDYDEEMSAALDTSPRIYGGLTAAETQAVEGHVEAGGHLVAEFNTFASPTPTAVRRRLERLLGVEWTGWSGRFFSDLGDRNEIPRWAPRLWREQYELEWEFRGPGFVLVHSDTRLFVLRQPQDVEGRGLSIHGDRDHPLVADTVDGVAFTYWFDVVTPRPGARVAATFRLAPTDSGRALLETHGVPVEYPAMVVASESPLRVYFAGDFADATGGLGPAWLEGMPWLNRMLLRAWFPRTMVQESFYWGFYIPVTRSLLASLEPS